MPYDLATEAVLIKQPSCFASLAFVQRTIVGLQLKLTGAPLRISKLTLESSDGHLLAALHHQLHCNYETLLRMGKQFSEICVEDLYRFNMIREGSE